MNKLLNICGLISFILGINVWSMGSISVMFFLILFFIFFMSFGFFLTNEDMI